MLCGVGKQRCRNQLTRERTDGRGARSTVGESALTGRFIPPDILGLADWPLPRDMLLFSQNFLIIFYFGSSYRI